jgi:undecaprenyl-diphosphatase
MNQKHATTKRPRLWRTLATLVLVVIGLWLVAANWRTFRRGFTAAAHAHPAWLLAGLLLTGLTFLIAAAIYRLLALRAVRYRQLLVVELAAAFANRLLPAGLGGLSLHGLYLYRRKHTAAQATAVVSTNNLLGIVAHLSLLVVLLCFRPSVLQQLTGHASGFRWWYVWLAAGIILLLLAVPKLRRALAGFLRNLLQSFRLLKAGRLAGAFALALLLTSTYTLILFSAARAVGLQLGVLQIFIVFSLGMLVGTATPTPGGLVGVEAGLYGGFVGYGASPAASAAAVIVYRLLTYWLPLVPGCIALLVARGRRFL